MTAQGTAGLATHLGIDEEDLPSLPNEVVLRAMQEDLNWSIAQQAQVLVALKKAHGRATGVDKLASVLEEQRQEKIHPWKADQEEAAAQHRAFAEAYKDPGCWDELRKEFEAQAKAGMLSTLECLVGQYALYSDTRFGPFTLMAMILRLPAAQRVKIHNWGIANAMNEGRILAVGKAVSELTVPLFPEVGGLSTLNTKLLSKGTAAGGDEPAEHVRLFRNSRSGDIFSSPSGVHGGGYAPIGQLSDGAWYTDTSALEKQNAELRRQIAGLEKKVARVSEGRPDNRHAQPDGRQPQQGRGFSGRNQGRGRSGARGGSDQTSEDTEPSGGAPPHKPSQNGAVKQPTLEPDAEVRAALALLKKRGFQTVQ